MRDVARIEDEFAVTNDAANSPTKTLDPKPVHRDFAAFPESDLTHLLGEAVWDRLPWRELPPGKLDRGILVQAYNGSLERIDTFKQDVTGLLTAACQANLEFRQGRGLTHEAARDRALEVELQSMLSRANWKATPTMSVVDADVVSQPTLFLRRRLNAAIGQAIDDFTAEFAQLLDGLVKAKLIGRIAWKPNHCCSYDFIKQVVVQENVEQSKNTQVEFSSDFRNRVVGQRIETEVQGGRHLHQREEHEHVVISAVRTSIGDTQVVMPPAVVALTKQVPEWLYPFVQVVDGDLCTESIEAEAGKVENWQEVSVIRRPIYGWEPAVIIGPYVLTGWGPREVAAELARRDANAEREKAQQFSSRNFVSWFGAAVLSLAAFFLLFRALNGAGGTFFAILSALAALTLTWQATFDREIQQQNPAAAARTALWRTATVGCVLLAIGLLMVKSYHPIAGILPLGFLIGAAASAWMADSELHRRNLNSFMTR